MHKEWERVLRFLTAGPVEIDVTSRSGEVLLENNRQGAAISIRRATLAAMEAAGVVRCAGSLLRLSASEQPVEAPQSDILGAAPRVLRAPKSARDELAPINLAESPLGLLMRRRGKDGNAFLSTAEFNAGERLRADFTRGSMMPRLGANWEAAVSSGKRRGESASELGDAALAARLRVEHALAAVGPELSGILVDVCCFLKGLEQVESERQWPVRSAKVVLRSALSALARHYDPRSGEAVKRSVLHWGASDYRPALK